MELPFLDPIILQYVPNWQKDVLKRDKDKVIVVDGREGCGKSVLAQQLASHLDPEFNINKIAFNAEQFMSMIKSPDRKKGDCIILDEAFLASNARSSLSQVNKAMVGLATEMRQLNLFVIIVLPTYFDLDRYFAIWRTDMLLHVFFNKEGDRGFYYAYNHEKKKSLYLKGKKFYNYNMVKTGLPVCRFRKGYVVDEEEYRKKKAEAFRENKGMTKLEQRYKDRCYKLVVYLHKEKGLEYEEIGNIIGLKYEGIKSIIKGEGVDFGGGVGGNISNIVRYEPEGCVSEEEEPIIIKRGSKQGHTDCEVCCYSNRGSCSGYVCT
jgi:energy-coupling factor transporter ATP-binding protein EcfA2